MKTKTVKTEADIFHNRVVKTLKEIRANFEEAKKDFLDWAKKNPATAIEDRGSHVAACQEYHVRAERLRHFLGLVGAKYGYATRKEAVQACLDEAREVLIREAASGNSSCNVANGIDQARRRGLYDAVRTFENLVDHEFI